MNSPLVKGAATAGDLPVSLDSEICMSGSPVFTGGLGRAAMPKTEIHSGVFIRKIDSLQIRQREDETEKYIKRA